MSHADHQRLYQQFSCSPWLAHVGEPDKHAQTMGNREEMIRLIEDDPDSFYAPPYRQPYEDLCCADHQRAAALERQFVPETIKKLSRQAYIDAWRYCPYTEICALLSDDVRTIATLLIRRQPLTAFTLARMQWYVKGRMPWGYRGQFPDGQWLVL